MTETLREALEDIRRKLDAGIYQNEEHVRLSLVARVVQALGWDIWNPGEVNAEYKATPQEDNTKVDLTLLTSPRSAAVFIEIKDVGKLIPNLNTAEIQMKGYLRNYSAPFCILSDGQHWRFYYIYANRIEFSDKCFKNIDLLLDGMDEVDSTFDKYLSKDNHLNGRARIEAEKEMDLSERERRIRECLPEARDRIEVDPAMSLIDALIRVANEREHLDVCDDEARKCIQDNPIRQRINEPSVTLQPTTHLPQLPFISRRHHGMSRGIDSQIRQALIAYLKQFTHSVPAKQVENYLYDKFKETFDEPYWQTQDTFGFRWKHRIASVKAVCVRNGIIKSPQLAGTGNWELTERGRLYE